MAGPLPAECVARADKLGQVVARIFRQGRSARYIVLQGEIVELLLAGAPLLLLKIELTAVDHAIFGRLRNTGHIAIGLLNVLRLV